MSHVYLGTSIHPCLSYNLYAALKCPVGIAVLLWLPEVPLYLVQNIPVGNQRHLSALTTAHT